MRFFLRLLANFGRSRLVNLSFLRMPHIKIEDQKSTPSRSRSYFQANILPISDAVSHHEISIDVLITCSEKDLTVLKKYLGISISTFGNYDLKLIHIVVPDSDEALFLNQVSDFRSLPIRIHRDSEFVKISERSKIFERYGWRTGWVVQQLIKIRFIQESASDNVFLLDADTIIMKPRNWLDETKQQILLIAEERNEPYYKFIETLGGFANRQFSFVTHHMLIQREFLLEGLKNLNISQPHEQLHALLSRSELTSDSPFSLDYELYGQFMLRNHRELCQLEKWSNLSLSREGKIFRWPAPNLHMRLRNFYASVNFHSWQ